MKKDFLRKNKLILNLHGGLGNQIFQMHYAFCMQSLLKLTEVKVFYSKNRKSPRSVSKNFTPSPAPVEYLTKFRIPKILEKLRINEGVIKFKDNYYLDGYYQSPSIFEKFSDEIILSSLLKLRKIFLGGQVNNGKTLIHLRLTDFFKNSEAVNEFLQLYKNKLPDNVDIITDDEFFLVGHGFIKNKNLSLISTSELEPEELLLKISEYRIIYSNDSTISFWASCLSGAEYIGYSNRYQILNTRFKNILHPEC
jgi:hypothetical protein